MRIACLTGWSFGKAETRGVFERRFPGAEIAVLDAMQGWETELGGAGSFDWFFGYSLGSFLALSELELVESAAGRIALLAPFEDFKAEAKRGGRTRRGQLGYLLKWLDRDALGAVSDFRARAELPEASRLEQSVETLKWGIEVLCNESRASGSLAGLQCYVGEGDPLLDSQELKRLYPHIDIVPDAGHRLDRLLEGVEDR